MDFLNTLQLNSTLFSLPASYCLMELLYANTIN